MNNIVSKFGGTSMGTASSMQKIYKIIGNYKKTPVIVVSAVGGVTDHLLKLGKTARDNKNWINSFNKLKNIHLDIIDKLKIDLNLESFFEELKELLKIIANEKELTGKNRDHLLGFGERMSSLILSNLLIKHGINTERINSGEIISTDNNYGEAAVDFNQSNKLIRRCLNPLLKNNIIPIITGFIGKSKDGRYSTLGRGGSDYSAAIIAAAINSEELHVWTDVDGIFSSDPRHFKKAKIIPTLSFSEAAELAYFGAKVLHPKTILPAIDKHIPVIVKNTFNPEAEGTKIIKDESNEIKALTWRKGVTILNICSTRMLDAHGFLAKIFDVFAEQKVGVDVLASSEVSVSVTVDEAAPNRLIKALSEFSTVTIQPKQTIVCLVGGGLSKMNGVLARLFGSIKDHNINMVSQGGSRRNITFLVNESALTEVTDKIFNEFFY